MLAPVADLDDARQAIQALDDLGYRHAEHRSPEALWFYEQQAARSAARATAP